ncbi:MAG TPA: phosphatase PAP2-related protein [Pseudomonadota bacterium]|nr:phosphatase PAP2-related protein [Pseudomonadota bacterium]
MIWERVKPWGTRAAAAVLFRYVCFVAMIALSLWAESRPAPHLPDLLIDRIPYVESVDRYNYWLLAAGYVPMAVWLLVRDPKRFCRYCVSAGLLSLLRGVCIVVTGLGPVLGPDLHAGMFDRDPTLFARALLDMASPLGLLLRDAPHVYLTKDLFFSGHTAATCLLLLYVWPFVTLRRLMLATHIAVVASVFFAHLHYTIDVIGAYAMALAMFALREGWPQGLRLHDGAT